jgi:hypothetical protein
MMMALVVVALVVVALVVVALALWLFGSLALWLSKKSVFLKI